MGRALRMLGLTLAWSSVAVGGASPSCHAAPAPAASPPPPTEPPPRTPPPPSLRDAAASLEVTPAPGPAREKEAAPVCARVGTRSEGWAWPDGRFIHWAHCKGQTAQCRDGGQGRGWYARSELIVAAPCEPKTKEHP